MAARCINECVNDWAGDKAAGRRLAAKGSGQDEQTDAGHGTMANDGANVNVALRLPQQRTRRTQQ